jgi:GTP-binding protein
MLQDRARIHVQAGAGGGGAMSFRREAHVPRGGPDGGDGGHGGAVVFVCDDSLRDLQSFRRRAHFAARPGGRGEGALRHGADGETLEIRVPPGTQIIGSEADGGELAGRRWELLDAGQRATVARGGRGGKGNKRFATPTRQAPRFAEQGLAGEQGWLELRLRLLADVGLVGLPNAGKSSLLARLTRAAPKVASYPFTTLSPVLGVLEGEDRQLVLADIPGLIEGASEGAGLGHEFLAHIERTRLLVHVIDVAPELSGDEDADAIANHAIVEHELAAHNEQLARLPRVLALSKVDLLTPERAAEAIELWRGRLGREIPVIATSSATGAGLDELAAQLLRTVGAAEEPAGRSPVTINGSHLPLAAAARSRGDDEALAEHMVFRPAGASGFQIERLGPRSFAVRGRGIEQLLERYDVENDDAMAYFEERLRRIGVLRALEDEGFEPGDEIEIAGVTFELDPTAAG